MTTEAPSFKYAGEIVRTRTIRLAAGLLGAVGALAAGGEALVRWEGLIDTDRFVRTESVLRVLDRRGAALRVVRGGERDHRWVALSEISPHLVSAVLAAEDARFWAHDGIDRRALVRAVYSNLVPWRRRSGGSTITQQLVKRVYGRPHGLWDKGIEVLRAVALERRVSKDEILEQYLNRLPFGDGIEGVARASEAYFGHGVAQLTVAEAALLAGIPQAPGRTEPRGHLRRALARRDYVLGQMHAHGLIDGSTWQAALAERPTLVGETVHPAGALRFTEEISRRWRAGDLRPEEGAITTSLDAGLQREAEHVLRSGVERFAARGARNGAAVVVRNATGEIFAYVGAALEDGSGGAMDLLRRHRQPGSTLKSFVYERFFETGANPATVLSDTAGRWSGHRGAQYEARDYDGRERGPVRARDALAASLNLAALDAAGRVGQDALVARLRALGFARAQDPSALGAGLVLGGLDVTPLELASAYVTLARGGTRVPLAWVPTPPQPGRPVMDPAAAAMTLDVLRDPEARTRGFGRSLADYAPGDGFALKTGTSSGWRDAWCAVADASWTVVVWLGDPRGAPMAAVSGFEAAAPLAAQLLGAARRVPDVPAARELQVRSNLVPMCAHSGLRAGPRCRRVVHEAIPAGRVLPPACEAHDEVGNDLVSGRFARWVERARPAGLTVQPASTGALRIVAPRDGARFLATPGASLALVATVGGTETRAVRWSVDARSAEGTWRLIPGRHTVVAQTPDGRSAQSVVEVVNAQ